MRSRLIALLVLSSATAVSAAGEQPEPPKKDKVICKTEKITGTRSRVRRTCMTAAEWDAVYNATQQAMQNFHRGSNQSAPALTDGAGGSPLPNAGAPQ